VGCAAQRWADFSELHERCATRELLPSRQMP
jgi:hypothetical protein